MLLPLLAVLVLLVLALLVLTLLLCQRSLQALLLALTPVLCL
jgi:hypothetical protein